MGIRVVRFRNEPTVNPVCRNRFLVYSEDARTGGPSQLGGNLVLWPQIGPDYFPHDMAMLATLPPEAEAAVRHLMRYETEAAGGHVRLFRAAKAVRKVLERAENVLPLYLQDTVSWDLTRYASLDELLKGHTQLRDTDVEQELRNLWDATLQASEELTHAENEAFGLM